MGGCSIIQAAHDVCVCCWPHSPRAGGGERQPIDVCEIIVSIHCYTSNALTAHRLLLTKLCISHWLLLPNSIYQLRAASLITGRGDCPPLLSLSPLKSCTGVDLPGCASKLHLLVQLRAAMICHMT